MFCRTILILKRARPCWRSRETITDSRLLFGFFFPENDQSTVNRDPDLVFELVWAFLLAWGYGYCSQAGPVDL